VARSPFVALVALLAGACSAGGAPAERGPTGPGPATVVEVIDGDTIDVRMGDRTERVRLLGIDTPESVDPDRPVECHGPEASALTSGLLPVGTAVALERDEEARDHFGRLLAYVFRLDDGLFVNEAIVAAGEAELLSIAPNQAYADRLATAAAGARDRGDGLWGGCPPGER
jgi:micrococcal nuclease